MSLGLCSYGLAKDKDKDFEMSLFEIGSVGLPVALAGLVYVLVLAPRWLPDRDSHLEHAKGGSEYVLTVVVRAVAWARYVAWRCSHVPCATKRSRRPPDPA